MKTLTWIPMAAAVAMSAGVARAQTPTNTTGVPISPRVSPNGTFNPTVLPQGNFNNGLNPNTFGTPNPGFSGTVVAPGAAGPAFNQQPFFLNGQAFVFQPGFGFVPSTAGGLGTGFNNGFGTGFGDGTISGYPNGFNGTNNFGFGLNNGFTNVYGNGLGYGGGYYGGYYGPGWGGVYSFPNPAFAYSYGNGGGGFRSGTGVPMLGVNTPPARSYGMVTGRVPGTRTRTARNTEVRVSGSQTNGAGVSPSANMSRNESRLVAQVKNIMAERPMRSGEVTKIGSTGVSVRYRLGSSYQESRFPIDQVYFFRDNGDLATVAMSPGTVEVGDSVMIADPTTPRIREEVAGRRQEMWGTSADQSVVTSVPSTKRTVKAKAKTTATKRAIKAKSRR